MERLLGFYEGLLRDGQVLPASSSIGEAPEQPAISADVYTHVLSGAHTLLQLCSLNLDDHHSPCCVARICTAIAIL